MPLPDDLLSALDRARLYADEALRLPQGVEIAYTISSFPTEREANKTARGLQQAFYNMRRREHMRAEKVNSASPYNVLSAVIRKSTDGSAWLVHIVDSSKIDAGRFTVRDAQTGEIIHHLSHTEEGKREEEIIRRALSSGELLEDDRAFLETHNPSVLENLLKEISTDA